jgi:threonylcarbamoyladenosine tRNA methylthiotransferase MtaB
MKKVAFYTLGCKLNFSETSTISRTFEERGFKKVDFTDAPDIFIINTCSVTENADKKCRKIVREAKAISPDSFVAIVGCYAQLKPSEISEIPGVDAVLGAAEKFRLHELLGDFSRTKETKVFAGPISAVNSFNTSWSVQDRTRTFLKVQDGCDYSCTFCTIPLARGSSRSDTIDNIVKKADEIGKSGVKEIVLTGVNTGDFGIRDGKRAERFFDLIQALDQVSAVDRFRISSIEPNLLHDEIIEFVAGSNRFMPHFHIPLQSGSDKILKSMRRRYLRELYSARVEKIKSLMPHACIGVDVIVGFPGESDADFIETSDFLKSLDVSYLHVFTYSERAQTPAAAMDGVVPQHIRAERSAHLHLLSDKIRRHFYQAHIGTTQNVLFEKDIEDGRMFGFTENYIRVGVKYDPLAVNELRQVVITGIDSNSIATAEEAIQPLTHLQPDHHAIQ